jgi:hypothetical protein
MAGVENIVGHAKAHVANPDKTDIHVVLLSC